MIVLWVLLGVLGVAAAAFVCWCLTQISGDDE